MGIRYPRPQLVTWLAETRGLAEIVPEIAFLEAPLFLSIHQLPQPATMASPAVQQCVSAALEGRRPKSVILAPASSLHAFQLLVSVVGIKINELSSRRHILCRNDGGLVGRAVRNVICPRHAVGKCCARPGYCGGACGLGARHRTTVRVCRSRGPPPKECNFGTCLVAARLPATSIGSWN